MIPLALGLGVLATFALFQIAGYQARQNDRQGAAALMFIASWVILFGGVFGIVAVMIEIRNATGF